MELYVITTMCRELKLKLKLFNSGLIKLLIFSLDALNYLSTIIAKNLFADLLLLCWVGLHLSELTCLKIHFSGTSSLLKSKTKSKKWSYLHSSVQTNWSWKTQQMPFLILPLSKSQEDSGWTLLKYWRKIPNIKILTFEKLPSSQ